MEGVPVTAATGVLGPVIAKLGALLGGEYKLRHRTRKDVKFIKSKLKSVHSILWMIWEKEILDAESKDLKKEALDLADDMHDAIDDFILTMERSRRNKHLMIQSKIKASPFQDLKTRVHDVSGRCRSKWKWEKNKCAEPISSLFSRRDAKSSPPSKPPPRAPFVRKDESEPVGMSRWRDELTRYLVGEEESVPVQPLLKMASIVGMAGVGKTTLARLVYEEIGNKFQSRAFVSVTPTPNMKEVLTSILQQVGAEPLPGTKARTEEQIIQTISNFLEDKRYLVIIDDIWHHGEWEIISKSFPENNLGSRILMTTRIHSLPGDDFHNNELCIRMNPRWSSEKKRWLYGPDKEDVSARMKPDMVGEGFDCDHPIVRMCGGVPLALLCMFSAMETVREQQGLHVKACDVQEMIEKQVKQSGIQNTPGFEALVESLQLGYDDLPHHMLKTCLLYCSIYPEKYHFDMNDLVTRWVAEGFIYKEDAGKGYFEELVNRGLMMQLGKDSYQMNPMMWNFLRWKSREDNFITSSSDITSPYDCRIHRLCIDGYPDVDGAVEEVDHLLDWSQIRSLVVCEAAKRLPFEKLERMRMLDLQLPDYLADHHVKDICGLLRVRHLLGLWGDEISEIPQEIGRLQYLETLQLSETSITELPGEIGDLQQLKTLDLRGSELAEVPREIGDLQHLETLCIRGTAITKLPCEIGRLKKLKTLDVSRNLEITELPSEIGNLQNLETLDLDSNMVLTKLPSEIGNLRNLETLNLNDNMELTKLPREIGNLQNLKRLILTGTQVAKLPKEIRMLKKLKECPMRTGALPCEASQLSKLEGVPECVRQALKNSDLVSVLAGEILSIQMVRCVSDTAGLIVGTKHMHIPQWIKDHFNYLGSLDIRICKLEEQDLKILRGMPNLVVLKLRYEVVPREPIAISREGFPRLQNLTVDSRMPRVTFQEGAMAMLEILDFEFQFYGGPPNKDPLGIKHLGRLRGVVFRCNEEWYGGANNNPCIRAMIDVMWNEAHEHPNQIYFEICGCVSVSFPAKSAQVSSSTRKSELTKILEAQTEHFWVPPSPPPSPHP